MLVELDEKVLTIGRDALRWMDNIKHLHEEILMSTVYVDFFEYNVAAILESHFRRIKSEGEALAASIELFKNGEAPPAACLVHIEKIRQSYNTILKVCQHLLKALMDMEKGVVKELGESEYVKKELAGLEALMWRINEVTDPAAHTAVRRIISHTRYGEKKEKRMVTHVQDAVDSIKTMIRILEKSVIPNITGDLFKELGKSTVELSNMTIILMREGKLGIIVRTYNIYVMIAQRLGISLVENGTLKVANKYKVLLTKMEDLKKEISDFEAREGALLQELESGIKKFKVRGWLQPAA